MVAVSTRLKSVLLGLSIIIAMPVTSKAEMTIIPTDSAITSFAQQHKIFLLSLLVALLFYAESDLRTKGKADYSWSQFPDDLRDLLDSNFLSLEPFNKFKKMFKKYFVGLPVKLDDMTTRTKEENGSIITLKSKKLVQKPFGVYGNFDAYILMHLKKFTDYIPVIATAYLLVNNPTDSWKNAITKINK